MADNLTELPEFKSQNQKQSLEITAEGVFPVGERGGESLEPGELTEGEEEEVSLRSQVLERRASIP
jgi:hypothetical protein